MHRRLRPGFGIVTLIGFALGAPGAISALGGLFAVIAGSMLCCCGPKEAGKGACTHTAAMVMCILGAICHLIGSLWLIIWYVTTMAAIEEARTQCRADCGTNDDTAWWAESCNETCDGIAAVSSAVITAAIIFMIPTIIFAVVTCAAPLSSAAPPSPCGRPRPRPLSRSFILEIVCACKCMAARRCALHHRAPPSPRSYSTSHPEGIESGAGPAA